MARKKLESIGPKNAVESGSVPPPDRPRAFSGIPKGWQPASDVLDRVTAVPTRFVGFNRASRVGGLPVRRIHTVHGPTHQGKAQPLDARVLTPSGWRLLGELAVGDLVVGRSGKPTRVVGVFPQGRRTIYRVTLSDGAETRCCAEHLWLTVTKREWFSGAYVRGPRPERSRIRVDGYDGWRSARVRSLAEIVASGEEHEIPLVGPVEFAHPVDGSMPLDPYLLGLLLGDGCLTKTTVVLCNPETDVRRAVAELLPGADEVRERTPLDLSIVGGSTLHAIRSLGLDGCRSWEKFVPDSYLRAAAEDRLALLRGLLDTDGHVVVAKGWDRGSSVEFSTTSPRLACAVEDLVRGLGGYARTRWRAGHYTKDGERFEARRNARVRIWFQNGVVPVSSSKHLERWTCERQGRVRRVIESVEPVGEEECACIRVEDPEHLYVTDDYVVTHNSAFVGGLVESFVTAENIGAYIDAEHATPDEWFSELFKRPLKEVSNFFAERPRNYEETITKVDALLSWVKGVRAEERKAGRRPPHAILAVDSINKLVPKRELEQLMAKGGDAIDKAWGRLRAAMNQSWLDHLTPLLGDADCALVLVAQERKEDDELSWDPSRAVQIKGGGALTFDASMVIRVSKGAPVRLEKDVEGSPIVGFKHRVRIWKNKVGHLDGRYTDCFFHLSNGKLTPGGFDTARDLVEVGKDLEVVKVSGSWLSWGKKRWQGEKRAVLAISADSALEADLLASINEAIVRERTS